MRSKTKTAIVLSVLLFLIGTTNYCLLYKDTMPPFHDANVCYSSSCEYYNYFIHGLNPAHIKAFFSHINFYPPLYMLVPIPFYLLSVPNHDIMAMVNIIYLILLAWSIYKLGNFVFNKPCGLFAVVIAFTFPAIIGFSRITHINIALTAILTLNIYILLRADCFSSRKLSIAAGIIAGIGFWFSSKYTVYFIAPALLYLLYSLFAGESGSKVFKKSRIINSILFVAIATLFFSIYYVPVLIYRLSCVPDALGRAGALQLSGVFTNFQLDRLLSRAFEYIGLLSPLILIPNLVLLFLATIVLMPALLKQRKGLICLSWFLSAFFMLSLIAGFITVQPRFLLPILPLAAVLIAGLLLRIDKLFKLYFSRISTVLIIVLFIIILGADYIFFLKQHPYPQNAGELLGNRVQYGLLHAVDKETPVAGLFDFLDIELAGSDDKRIIVALFEDGNDTAPLTIELIYEELRNTSREIKIFTPMGLSITSRWRQYDYKQNEDFVRGVFMAADYLLYIIGDGKQLTMGRFEERLYGNNKILQQLFSGVKEDTKLIWQSQADIGSFSSETLLLYRLDK